MEIPDWDDYQALQKQNAKLEQALFRVAELAGVAKFSFMNEIFHTRAEAEEAEKVYYDTQKTQFVVPGATGCIPQPTVTVELPEL